jgi:hypothetical protein
MLHLVSFLGSFLHAITSGVCYLLLQINFSCGRSWMGFSREAFRGHGLVRSKYHIDQCIYADRYAHAGSVVCTLHSMKRWSFELLSGRPSPEPEARDGRSVHLVKITYSLVPRIINLPFALLTDGCACSILYVA